MKRLVQTVSSWGSVMLGGRSEGGQCLLRHLTSFQSEIKKKVIQKWHPGLWEEMLRYVNQLYCSEGWLRPPQHSRLKEERCQDVCFVLWH